MNRQNELVAFERDLAITAETLGADMSETIVLAYFQALETYSLVDVQRALAKARRMMKWFPKPLELIAILTPDDTALVESAWLECLELTKRDPWNSTVAIADPLLHAVVRSFGGPTAIYAQGDKFATFNKKRFEESYRSHLDVLRNFGTVPTATPFAIGDFPKGKLRRLHCVYAAPILRAVTAMGSNHERALLENLASKKRIEEKSCPPD